MSEGLRKEIDEAVNAANDALYNLSNAESVLKSAKGWGIADILGGRMIVTAIKRGKMNEADAHLRAAQYSLDVLNRELKDISNSLYVEQVNDVFALVDFLFDNFFTDIIAQNKINQSLEQVRQAMAQVEGVLDALEEISATL